MTKKNHIVAVSISKFGIIEGQVDVRIRRFGQEDRWYTMNDERRVAALCRMMCRDERFHVNRVDMFTTSALWVRQR